MVWYELRFDTFVWYGTLKFNLITVFIEMQEYQITDKAKTRQYIIHFAFGNLFLL